MAKCWAAALGDCAGQITGEHLMSEALWEGTTIDVVGLPWCKDSPKTIGLASLTSNILCASHNSRLSPVDQAGADSFRSLREAYRLANERRAQRQRKWKVKRFEIDGSGLERWLLKTSLNLFASEQSTGIWEFTNGPLSDIPPSFVRAAFGLETLPKPFGLYGVGGKDEPINSSDHVTLATVLRDQDKLVGVGFTFRGHRFFLDLTDKPMPEVFTLPNHNEPGWKSGELLYHLAALKWKVGRKLSHYCHIMWPGGRLSPFDMT